MIGALLSNTPVNLLKGNGVAGGNASGSEATPLDRNSDSAGESQASPRAAALRSGSNTLLTREAILALQETARAEQSKPRNTEQTGDKETEGSAQGLQRSSVAAPAPQPDQNSEKDEDPDGDGLDEAEERQVEKLAKRDREVKAHEQAHARVGGAYASAPSYTFQQGPDGKRYAVGGEVQIDTSTERTPEATIRKMQIVIRAATAPAEPSSQDLKVAQQARSQLSEAQAELRQQKAEELKGDDGHSIGAVDRPSENKPESSSDASERSNNLENRTSQFSRSQQGDEGLQRRKAESGDAIAAYQSAINREDDARALFGSLIA